MELPQYRGTDLDPVVTQYDDNFVEHLDINVGAWYCVVSIPRPQEKTAGGLILPDSVKDLDTFIPQFGKIVAVGPLFYNRIDFKDVPKEQKPKVGDVVHFKEYQGWKFAKRAADGKNDIFMVLTDKDIAFFLGDGLKASDFGRFS